MIKIDGNQSVGAGVYLTNSDGEFSGFLSDEIDSDIEIAIDDNSDVMRMSSKFIKCFIRF